MKKAVKVIGGIIAGVLVIGGGMCLMLTKDIPAVKALTINHVDLSQVQDGTYEGKYKYSRWKSKVQVVVKDGKLVSVQLLSAPLIPDISDRIYDEMIDEQKVDVDTVTGATATSKAYMKAVENALTQSDTAK